MACKPGGKLPATFCNDHCAACNERMNFAAARILARETARLTVMQGTNRRLRGE
jgi:hypothetical protein